MKDLYKYLIESATDGKDDETGSWQEFVDEDTGELVKMWVPKVDPEKEMQKIELAQNDYDSYDELIKQEKELRKQLDPLEDELWGYQQDLKDVNREYKDLQMDMEQEVGGLYTQGKEADAEKLAQKYGDKFNKLEKRQQVLRNKIKKLEPKVEKLSWKIYKLWDK